MTTTCDVEIGMFITQITEFQKSNLKCLIQVMCAMGNSVKHLNILTSGNEVRI